MLKLTANHQKLGEKQTPDSSSQLSEGIDFTDTLILNFWPLALWDNAFLLFMQTDLWQFVEAALAN